MPRSCRCPAFWRPCDRDQQGELTWRLQRRRPRRLRPSPPRPRPAPRRRPRRRRSNSIFPAPPGALTPQERSPGNRIFAPDRPDFLSGLSAFRPFDVARSPIRGTGDRCGRRPPHGPGRADRAAASARGSGLSIHQAEPQSRRAGGFGSHSESGVARWGGTTPSPFRRPAPNPPAGFSPGVHPSGSSINSRKGSSPICRWCSNR